MNGFFGRGPWWAFLFLVGGGLVGGFEGYREVIPAVDGGLGDLGGGEGGEGADYAEGFGVEVGGF